MGVHSSSKDCGSASGHFEFIKFVANLIAIFLRGDLLVAALISNDVSRVHQP